MKIADSPIRLDPRSWWDVLKRVKDEIRDDNLTIVAAGVAFYAFLALMPALSAVVSTWGIFADPATLSSQLEMLKAVLPAEGYTIVERQMTQIASSSSDALGWGLVVSIVLSVWSAKKGVQAIVKATNMAYDQTDERGFLKQTFLTLGLTFGATLMTVVICAVIVVLPSVVHFIGLGHLAESIVTIARWPIVFVAVIGVLAVLYRISPNRTWLAWRWVLPGALLATVGWLAASAAFSFFIANFGNFNETYGALGAVVVLMFWFYISAFVVLLGAELNSEVEPHAAS